MSDVLDFIRERIPATKDIPDNELTEFLGESMPGVRKALPEFDAEYRQAKGGRLRGELEVQQDRTERAREFYEEVPNPLASLKKGFKSAEAAKAVSDAERVARTRPEAGGRRAFVEAMTDPEYTGALASASSPEEQQAIEARLGPETRTTLRRRTEQAAEKYRDLGRVGQEGAAMDRWNQAQTGEEAWEAFKADPLKVLAGIGASGMGSSVRPLIQGAAGAAVAGPVGMAAGVGLGSGEIEYASKIAGTLQEQGVNMDDPEAIYNALKGGAVTDEVRRKALAKGVAVGFFDALAGGFAGRLAPMFRTRGAGVAAELGSQMIAGGAGEAVGSVAAGDNPSGKAVFEEMAGELVPGATEVAIARTAQRVAGATATGTAIPTGMPRSQQAVEDSGGIQGSPTVDIPAEGPATRRDTGEALPQTQTTIQGEQEISQVPVRAMPEPEAPAGTAPEPVAGDEGAGTAQPPPAPEVGTQPKTPDELIEAAATRQAQKPQPERTEDAKEDTPILQQPEADQAQEGREVREVAEGQAVGGETVVDVEFSESLDEVTKAVREQSKQGIAPAQMKAAGKAVAAFFQKNLTARGDLPATASSLNIERVGKINSLEKEAEYIQRDFFKALRDAYKISRKKTWIDGYSSIPQDDIRYMDEYLKGGNDGSKLKSTEVKVELDKMRHSIDALSAYIVRNGLVDGDLATKIGNNLGTYLTRSYRVFDDPKWLEKIDELVDPSVRRQALNTVWSHFQQSNPGITQQEAWNMMRGLLDDWRKAGQDAPLHKGGKLGAKDLSLFLKRKNIDPSLRAVMGEYTDPVTNYVRSLSKIARLIANQEFLAQVRADGLGKWLFEEGKNPPGFDTVIAPEGSSAMSPLNGLRTSKAIAEAFQAAIGFNTKEFPWWARLYFAVNAYSKMAKTVGSIMSQVRNLFPSQLFFNLASGHLDVREYSKAVKAVAADAGVTNDKKFQAYYRDALRFGLLNESTHYNELRDTLRDAALQEKPIGAITGQSVKTAARQLIDIPLRAYRLSDELGKIVGWENEKTAQRRAHKNWTEEQVKLEAAHRVRNTYPTYSMVPRLLQQVRRQPIWGPFIAFSYEAKRTLYHNLRYAIFDMRSSNPEVVKNGARRLGGTIAATVVLNYGLATLFRLAAGITKDEEDDMRLFLPEWSKNSTLLHLDKDSYINWSYQNPYSYVTDAVNAAIIGDEKTMGERVIASAGEFLAPYTSEQMLAGALMDVSRNTRDGNRERTIYNPEDPNWSDDALAYIFQKALVPGTMDRVWRRIIPSFTDQQKEYGRKLDPASEIIRELSGIAVENFDYGQAIRFAAREFSTRERSAEDLFRKTVYRSGTVTPEQIHDAYVEADRSRRAIWKEMFDKTMAARRNGVTQDEILEALSAYGLSRVDRSLLVDGQYRPMTVSRQVYVAAENRGRRIPDTIEEYRNSVEPSLDERNP